MKKGTGRTVMKSTRSSSVERSWSGRFRPGDLVAFADGDGAMESDGGVQYPVEGEALTVKRRQTDNRVTCVNGHGHEIDLTEDMLLPARR